MRFQAPKHLTETGRSFRPRAVASFDSPGAHAPSRVAIGAPANGNSFAFTLLELLVVIVIIGLLASLGLPAIKGMTKSNTMIAASRQMLDDISAARQAAIANHTTVYMVFVPAGIQNITDSKIANQPDMLREYTNLYGGQFTTYALLSLRSIGDQPGVSTPRYLSEWRSLPNGVFIATNKFNIKNPVVFTQANLTNAPLAWTNLPFPLVSTNNSALLPTQPVPYIAFNYLGQLTLAGIDPQPSQQDVALPLDRGSIFYARDAKGNYIAADPDVQETPPGNSTNTPNIIYIDWLTGRAKVVRQEVQ